MDFNAIVDRRGTDSVKWDLNAKIFGTDDLLPLWVADTDFRAPEPAIEAMRRRLEHGVFGYTFRGDAFHDAIVGWERRRYGWEIRREWISFSPGVVPALALSVLACTEPGDSVLVQPPVYGPFFDVVAKNGRRIAEAPLAQIGGRYVMDFDALERAADASARMLILSSPHNPVGRAWTADELGRLAEFAGRKGLVILSDEIHSDIVYDGRHVPLASLSADAARRTITCRAPSKTFGLAGLTTSYVVIPDPDLKRRFDASLAALGVDGGNIFGAVALVAAYTECDAWLDGLVSYLRANRDRAVRFISERVPGVKAFAPESTFLLWLDCSELGMENDGLARFLAREAKIGLNSGTFFGGPRYGRFVRLNFGCPRATLDEALGRFERAVAGLGRRA